MYTNHYGAPSPQPGLTNNPFVGDPSTAHARFPDVAIAPSTPQPGYAPNGYQNQAQQYQQQYQQHPSQLYVSGGPHQAQPQVMSAQSQFASTSYAPQYPAQGQLGPQPTGVGGFQSPGGFAQGLPYQYSIPTGYSYPNNAYPSQAVNATPNYPAEFDPYAQRAQTQTQTQTPQPQINRGTSGAGPSGVAHPRDLIGVHKSGLESWDAYSWKQLFNACDALKEAWSARKQEAEGVLRQYGGHPNPAFGYNSQVEGWRQVLKAANNNFDTVAASTFQLREAFNSYRQSADQASKRRVRESCNAAVNGLPDWPSN